MRKLTIVEIHFAIALLIFPALLILSVSPFPLMNDDMFQEYFSHGFWRQAVQEEGKFPLWCPYVGGGYPLYAHPHDASTVLPLLPAVFLFGEVLGININLWLIWLLGLLGLRRLLLDEIGIERDKVWPILMLYGMCLPLWFRIISGNYNETLIYCLPAILACQRKALQRPLWLLAAALMLAALLAFGKFTAISTGAVCMAYSLHLALRRDEHGQLYWRTPLSQLALLAGLSLGLAGLKLLPMLDLLGRARLGQPFDYGPWFSKSMEGQIYCGLAVAALLLKFRARSWFWPGMLCGSVLLTAGARLPFNLARLLSHLPLLGMSFNDPGKYWSIPAWALFCVTLGAGLKNAKTRHIHRLLESYLLSLFICIFLLAGYFLEFNLCHGYKPSSMRGEYYQVMGRDMPRNGLRTVRSNEYYNLLRNVGTIDWYSDQIDLPSAVRPRFFVIAPPNADLEHPDSSMPRPYDNDTLEPNPDYLGESWVEPVAAGSVLGLELGVNRVTVTAKLNAPAVIVVNQNFDPYWMLERQPAAESNGLLASEPLEPGFHKLTWEYRPTPWRQGLLLSALSLILGTLLLSVWQHRIRCRERS